MPFPSIEKSVRSLSRTPRAAAVALALATPFAPAFAGQLLTSVESDPGTDGPAVTRSCEEAFSANFTRDSASFSFNDGSVGPETLEGRLEDAYAAVRRVAGDLGCQAAALELATVPGRDACATLVPGNPFSVSCYVESGAGFFFVTRDPLENVTVTFNRWD